MDFQKEKEAFEKHASKFFTTNEAFENDGENYVYDEVKFMWDCWLAAKAQAVPDGYKVVPKEPTQEILDAFPEVEYEDTYAGACSILIDSQTLKIGYKAMIEAQGQK